MSPVMNAIRASLLEESRSAALLSGGISAFFVAVTHYLACLHYCTKKQNETVLLSLLQKDSPTVWTSCLRISTRLIYIILWSLVESRSAKYPVRLAFVDRICIRIQLVVVEAAA